MTADPDSLNVEVDVRFRRLQAQDDPEFVIPATLATCPRCRATGMAAGQSGCSVIDAIESMRNACQGPHAWRYEYVARPGIDPPDDLVPA